MHMEPGTMGMSLIEHEGDVIGLAFGADATTEHECGIGHIRYAFRMPDKAEGIERCRARKLPVDQIIWEDTGTEAILVFGRGGSLDTLKERALRYQPNFEGPRVYPRPEMDLACAWSDESFGIRARGDMYPHLLTFKEALYSGKAALLLSGLFLMSGFNLILVDKFPADVDEQWIKRDRETVRLQKLWKDSGLEQMLREAGKKWFSLGWLLTFFNKFFILLVKLPPLSVLTEHKGRITNTGNQNSSEHLANNGFNMLIINFYTLKTINLLNLIYHKLGKLLNAHNPKNIIWIRGSIH